MWEFSERNYYFLNEKISLKDGNCIISDVLILREKLWSRWLVGISCSLEFTRRGLALLRLSWSSLPTEDVVFCKNSPWAGMHISAQEVVEAWQESACILLSFARQDWHTGWYEKIHKFLYSKPEGFLSADSCSRIAYQSILRHLERLEPDAALKKLEEWVAVPNDNSFWPVRRAMLWAELGDLARAKEQLLEALKNVRRRIQSEGETTHILSYEQWAAYYFSALKASEWMRPSERIELEQTVAEDRWKRAKHMPWHPLSILDDVENALVDALHVPPSVETSIGFGLGDRPQTRTLRSGFPIWLSAGFTFLALVEHVCLMLRVCNSYVIRSEMHMNAAALFCKFGQGATGLCLGIGLRSTYPNFMKAGQAIFSRRAMASLSDENISLLAHNSLNLIESFASKMPHGATLPKFQAHLRFALELLGRLSLRMREDNHQHLLRKSMKWHGLPQFINHPIDIEFGPFFERVVQSTSYAELALSLESLLTLPVSPPLRSDGYLGIGPDPVAGLPDVWPAPLRPLLAAVAWPKVVEDRLKEITRERLSAQPSDQILARYWRALTWMVRQNVLSDVQKAAIWTVLKAGYADGQWAKIPEHYEWAPLIFAPEEELDTTWQTYRTLVLSTLSAVPGHGTRIYSQLCITPELRDRYLTDDDELKLALLDALKPCLMTTPPLRRDHYLFNDSYRQDVQDRRHIIWLLCFICGPRIAALQDRCPWLQGHLRQFHQSCQQMGMSYLRLELVMVSLSIEGFGREILLRHIEDNLFMGDGDKAYEAGITLLTWLAYFPDLVPHPSLELLARAFALRQPFNQKLCSLLVERQTYMSEPFSKEELDHILPTLEKCADTLDYKYKNDSGNGQWDQSLWLELPEKRWWCGQLLVALWQSNPEIHEDSRIQHWVEIMRNDPLAEMRRLAEIIGA